jgi:hypothetical protein
METRKRLIDTPTAQHPFPAATYTALFAQANALADAIAARRWTKGMPDGAREWLAEAQRHAEAGRAAINQAWWEILEEERREREEG